MYEDISGLQVPQDLEIVVTTPAYFERLGPLLQDTDPEYVHKHMILCMHKNHVNFSRGPFLLIHIIFHAHA